MAEKLNFDIITLAKDLRRHQTDCEKIVWSFLRNKQIGYKFRRQQKIGNRYIVDFICLSENLVIEIDGGQHNEEVDKERTAFLEKEGFKILRFWNNDVLDNTEGVFTVIQNYLTKQPV